jgi:hypothetical protein
MKSLCMSICLRREEGVARIRAPNSVCSGTRSLVVPHVCVPPILRIGFYDEVGRLMTAAAWKQVRVGDWELYAVGPASSAMRVALRPRRSVRSSAVPHQSSLHSVIDTTRKHREAVCRQDCRHRIDVRSRDTARSSSSRRLRSLYNQRQV